MSRYDNREERARLSRYDGDHGEKEQGGRYDEHETPRVSRTRPEPSQGYSSRYRDDDERSDPPPSSTPSAYGGHERRVSTAADREEREYGLRQEPARERGHEREGKEGRDERYDERTFSRGYGGERSERDRERERDRDPRHTEPSFPVTDRNEAGHGRTDRVREQDLDRASPSRSAGSGYDKIPSQSELAARSAYAAARASAPVRAPSDVGTVSTSLQQQLRLTSFYVRPGFGKAGKPLDVLANFFQVRAKGGRAKLIHHYDVEINPLVRVQDQKKPKTMLRAIFEQMSMQEGGEWAESFAACAYDGRKNCFTPVPFPIKQGQVHTFITALASDNVARRTKEDSSSDDESRRFKVEIKHVAVIDLEKVMEFCRTDKKSPSGEEDCLTGVMATNVVMRDVPSKKYSQVGATGNRFFTLDGAKPIAHGALVCRGFMQSFRYSNCGLPLLNIDVGFSAFMSSGPAIDVIAKMIGGRGGPGGGRGGYGGGRGGYSGGGGLSGADLQELTPEQIRLIKNKLRGMKFTVTHRASTRLHTIMSITVEKAQDISFSMTDKETGKDRKVYVPEYFKTYCGVPVTKPRLPCIQYGKKNFIPLEFVHLADWNSLPPTKLSADQTADMIKVAAIKPKERMTEIIGWRKELAYESQAKVAAWGLQVNRDMIEVPARVLDPPRINYGQGRSIQPDSGNWNLRGNMFYQSNQPLKAWSFISFDRFLDQGDMQRYISYLCQTLHQHGVQIENGRPECFGPIDPRPDGNVEGALQQAARSAYKAGGGIAPQLICIVLPGRDAWLYERIKKSSFMDLKGPVPTQCMQAAKIRTDRGIAAYTGNLAMKIQSKLGGITHQIPITELPGMVKGKTMLLGADLGHPPVKAGYADAPTVACSIATYSPDCDMYSAQIRLQQGRQEIIQELTGMVLAHLEIFKKKNDGDLPDRILVFRDGISEGQYAAALQHEHSSIIRACQRIDPAYRPKVLICICAKRHNTRFFGKDRDLDRSGNLPAGTVIDTAVTHPYAFDFFLQAHAGRVGTARPTHYICLLDELGLTPDQLQKTVNALCFAFARCTTSVSLVPVCYIADLVCQKARIIVHEPGSSVAPSESSAGRGPRSDSGMTTTTALRARNAGVDVMQIQKVLMRNPELANVAWWM